MGAKSLVITYTDGQRLMIEKAHNFSVFGVTTPFVHFSVGFGESAINYMIPMSGIREISYKGSMLKL